MKVVVKHRLGDGGEGGEPRFGRVTSKIHFLIRLSDLE